MSVRRGIWEAVALYAGLFGLIVVSAGYFLTQSGLVMLGIGGIGLVLIVIGLVQPGPPSANVVGSVEAEGLLVTGLGLNPSSYSQIPVRMRLLLSGLGLVVWVVVVLTLFGSTLT